MCECIALAVFDEASAADGSCPLEQVADASGIAVGGTVLQMSRDLSRMKVLMTHSRSLTEAQQNWPPLIQEAFAQLEVKRASRKNVRHDQVDMLDRSRESDQIADERHRSRRQAGQVGRRDPRGWIRDPELEWPIRQVGGWVQPEPEGSGCAPLSSDQGSGRHRRTVEGF